MSKNQETLLGFVVMPNMDITETDLTVKGQHMEASDLEGQPCWVSPNQTRLLYNTQSKKLLPYKVLSATRLAHPPIFPGEKIPLVDADLREAFKENRARVGEERPKGRNWILMFMPYVISIILGLILGVMVLSSRVDLAAINIEIGAFHAKTESSNPPPSFLQEETPTSSQ